MKRIRRVAWHEFWVTVRRPGYLVITFGMPLFALAVAGVSMLAGLTAAKNALPLRRGPLGLVDESRLFARLELAEEAASARPATDPLLPEGVPRLALLEEMAAGAQRLPPLRFLPYPDLPAAMAAVEAGEIDDVLHVFPDYLDSGRMELLTRRPSSVFSRDGAPAGLRTWVYENLLAAEVDAKILNRVKRPFDLSVQVFAPDGTFAREQGQDRIRRLAVPYLFLILLIMAIFGTSGYLLQGVAEEKENRVLEVILCSVTPDQLLIGKLLGLGAAGLLQLAVWSLIAILPVGTLLAWLQIRPDTVLLCFLYFIFGYALYGGLMLGFGSLGSNYRESAQLAVVWSMAAVIPMFFIPVIVDQPNGLVARALSYFPLTTPITMMMRYAAGDIPAWEVALSFVILSGGIWIALKGSAKLFRVGLLLYGKKPSPAEIWRWLWA
ncbi:MAG: ABC transporter permease [Planctomycetes bacterium]|nr:ABC transporter permease [Planctomycetota bacterium]